MCHSRQADQEKRHRDSSNKVGSPPAERRLCTHTTSSIRKVPKSTRQAHGDAVAARATTNPQSQRAGSLKAQRRRTPCKTSDEVPLENSRFAKGFTPRRQ